MIELSEGMLNGYTGKYRVTPDREVTITRRGKLLHIQDGDFAADLYPESTAKFYLSFGDVQFEFIKGTGSQMKFVVLEDGKPVEEGVRSER